MRTIQTITLFAGISLAVACGAQNAGTDAKPAVPGYDSYGAVIQPEGAISTAELPATMANSDSADVTLEAEIITSCKKKGCWMDVRLPDGSSMKVRFVDYAFFVPTDGLQGKAAILKGRASKEVITEAMRRHYAHDAGKTKEEIEAIVGDRTELSFLAEGVLIRR